MSIVKIRSILRSRNQRGIREFHGPRGAQPTANATTHLVDSAGVQVRTEGAERPPMEGTGGRAMKRTLLFLGLLLFGTAMLAGPAAAQDCVEPPPGLVSWWPGDGNTDDIVGGHHGAILGGLGFAPGMVGDAFSLDSVDDGVEVPNTGGVFDLVSQWTIDAWVFPNELGMGRPIVWKQSRAGNFQSYSLREGIGPQFDTINTRTACDIGVDGKIRRRSEKLAILTASA